jgi:hypothetical protein
VDALHCNAPTPTYTPTPPNDTTTPDNALFRSPAANDWLLRADASAVIDKGTDSPAAGETDVDGDPRKFGPATDLGADEFVNKPPTFDLVTAPAAAQTGEAVAASVENASDPEAAYGGGIAQYSFDWGDGSPVEAGTATVRAHRYASAGRWTLTVTVTDRQGGSTSKQGQVLIAAPNTGGGDPTVGPGGAGLPGIGPGGGHPPVGDVSPPFVAVTSPRNGQRVRLRRGLPPPLRGRAADETGVLRVELALLRRDGPRCRWYDGRATFRLGPCTSARWFRAVLNDFDWTYAFPRRVRPAPGAYILVVRAQDVLGHVSTNFDVAGRTVVAFNYAR